jgi:putative membrane protein
LPFPREPSDTMEQSALHSLAGLPAFAVYFGLALVLLGLFLAIYLWITPYPEIKLIRDGNVAAGVSLGGAMIGFALPLAGAIDSSVSLIDMVIWALIALAVQLLAYFLVHRALPHLPRDVAEGKLASAVLLAATAIALGMLSAACMSY